MRADEAQQRLLTDPSLTPAEKLDDLRWRRSATPEEIARANALTARWYSERDAAERFKEDMTVLLDRKFEVVPSEAP